MVQARRQFLSEALRAPGNPGLVRQAQKGLSTARAEARHEAFKTLFKNIESQQKSLAKGAFDRLTSFFTGSKLLSASWFGTGAGDSDFSGASGAGTTGRSGRSDSRPQQPTSTSTPSGPALQYNGPKALDFRNSQ